MEHQLKKYLKQLSQPTILALTLSICACSSNQEVQTGTNTNLISPNDNYQITSNAAIEGRKIIKFRNSGDYQSAYDQISIWASQSDNLVILYQRDNITNTALEITAWKPDQELFNKILQNSPVMNKYKDAISAASESNFYELHNYYRCVFKTDKPSIQGCESEVEALIKSNPQYSEIWTIKK